MRGLADAPQLQQQMTSARLHCSKQRLEEIATASIDVAVDCRFDEFLNANAALCSLDHDHQCADEAIVHG